MLGIGVLWYGGRGEEDVYCVLFSSVIPALMF